MEFSFHYSNKTNRMTVNCDGQTWTVKHIECTAPVKTIWNTTPPTGGPGYVRIRMGGECESCELVGETVVIR